MFETIEVEISPGMSAADAVGLARRVDEIGVDRLGISDVVFWPDCFVLQALIAEATAVLTPVQPSVFDQDATKGFLEDVEELKRIRKGKVRVHLIANRIKARSRVAETLDYFLDELGHMPLTWLSERTVYAELAAQGVAIFDRKVKALEPLKVQWQPILDTLGA